MKTDYEEVLWEFISLSEKLLNNNNLVEVKHFYKHDEYEMALEGLLIEIIGSRISSNNFDLKKMKNLVIHYGLNKEFNFDELIWNKFLNWANG
ncbi:MAG: hypothetical protein K0R72_1257 [Clostridia bacterium]|jgi:hypothetical protein|nr:hypothetical protein [Clostridia bacterium]